MKALIFDIKRYAVHDGPGIRTTVFFKACPLNCWWCHNPESQDIKLQEVLNTVIFDGVAVNESEKIGKLMTINQVMDEIRKDILFFDDSGGGVTFSGGEPLMQHNFLLEILKQCKEEEIHTCVDTSGFSRWDKMEKILPYTELFLYDLKHFDNEKHIKYTGVSNRQIIGNLEKLLERGKEVWIRYPFIPELNDDENNLAEMQLFLRKHPEIKQLNILPYHNISNHKYNKLNKPYLLKDLKTPSEAQIQELKSKFDTVVEKVIVGG